jgi:hypothetical protein
MRLFSTVTSGSTDMQQLNVYSIQILRAAACLSQIDSWSKGSQCLWLVNRIGPLYRYGKGYVPVHSKKA